MVNIEKIQLTEHIVEIVSDSGEGAQKAANAFAGVCGRSGNGLWTVEIIPSEIQPPPHTVGSASGNRIRLSSKKKVTNAGDLANVIVAFNEMALLSRIHAEALSDDVLVIIDDLWAKHDDIEIRQGYNKILEGLKSKGARVIEVPIEEETRTILENPLRGKNMFVLGLLVFLYQKDIHLAESVVTDLFASKSKLIIENNLKLIQKGYEYAKENLPLCFDVPASVHDQAMVTMNGNTALAYGVLAAGFELCSMYPITPATSASHVLSDIFEKFGGLVHQAEDEIAAIGVALGAYYAGKPSITITSGPGMALKTEFQALAVMSETPLVIVDVQRGGPSTGLPTKIEQSDLLSSIYGTPGDAPKVVMAASTIEECFHILSTARKIAEEFRILVIVLSDANLATGQQLFEKPKLSEATLPPPIDLSPVPKGTKPFDWDLKTGLSRRLIPGQPGGMFVTTGLNHAADGTVVYDSESNQLGHKMRSRKLAVLQKALTPPKVYGEEVGDLLLIGWGSTRGGIEEAVDRGRSQGLKVSSLNLQFLSPLPPRLKEIFSHFKKVMTIEINYSDDWGDPYIDEESRRYSQLACLLRSQTLVDVDCYSRVLARPFMPKEIFEVIEREIKKLR